MSKFLLFVALTVPYWYTGIDHPLAAWLVINHEMNLCHFVDFVITPVYYDYWWGIL